MVIIFAITELTIDQYVTSTDKVSVYIDLRNRRPFPVQNGSTNSNWTRVLKDNERKLLNPTPQFWVSQHVIGLHLVLCHSLQVKNLDHGSGEPTLRFSRGTFHKKDNRFRFGSFFNRHTSFLGEVTTRRQATREEP